MNAIATPEAPAKEVVEAVEPPPFVMPRVDVGERVLWFSYAQRMPARPPEIAFVLKCNQKAIILRTASGQVKETVPHMDDPRLQRNEDMRADGAWDFTDAHKADVHRNADFEKRIAALEAKLFAAPSESPDAKKK